MNPDTRMAASLLFSLVVSANNLRMAAMGHADIVDVGIRYLLAFLAAFFVVGVAGRVFNAYIDAHAAAQAQSEGSEAEQQADRRRQGDGDSLTMPGGEGLELS